MSISLNSESRFEYIGSQVHPGVVLAMERVNWNELDIARALRDGRLASPMRYMNVTLFNIRITGTGKAYRERFKEHVWRPPEIYLNADFLERCQGLPVLMEHPEANILDTDEYRGRVIGSVMLPYIKEDMQEVWAVAKIHDAEAAEIMTKRITSTSPSVMLKREEAERFQLDNGESLLVEGSPDLLDHVAICQEGVWDRQSGPAGVEPIVRKDSVMPEEKTVEKPEPMVANDALDKILAGIDSIGKRCDDLGARMDAFEKHRAKKDDDDDDHRAKKDDDDDDKLAKKDEDEPESDSKRAKKDDDDHRAKKDDDDDDKRAKKDDEEEEKEMKETAGDKRGDSFGHRRQDARSDAAYFESDEYRDKITEAQVKADAAYAAHGKRAPKAMSGESVLDYRKRLLRAVQHFSDMWKDIKLSDIPNSRTLTPMETVIYADAIAAKSDPRFFPQEGLQEIRKTDPHTGRITTEFRGRHTMFYHMKRPSRRVVGFGSNRGN